MNKSNVRQKRSLGKDSPLSKRPKLDFTAGVQESSTANQSKSKESLKGCNGITKEKNSGSINGKSEDNVPSASDWGEDFSGEMLEKVFLLADISQAYDNNEKATSKLQKEKLGFEILESNKVIVKSQTESTESETDFQKLMLEIENLKDKLKTKEGEVHILRSQLKQSEDAKQAVALQNMKVLEEIQKKSSEKLNVTEKELESTKSKLLFRDLEYKTLSERCRQLEYNLSKSKLVEAGNVAKPISMSQTSHQKPNIREIHKNNQTNNQSSPADSIEGSMLSFEFPNSFHHEGKCLMKIICPEFFKFISETSVVPFYKSYSRINSRSAGVDFGKTEKYKWTNLPEQSIYIKDLYKSVSNLFTYNNFIHKEAREIVQTIFEQCCEILKYQKKVLLFLEELQCYSDYDEADHSLLENEEEVRTITIKDLIDGAKLNKEECGIEGRRSLALIYSLIKASEVALDLVKTNCSFLELLRSLSAAVGTLRRPLRYNGILIGVSLILQKLLEEKNLTKELLVIIDQTVEELIFSRPKLDVLKEVVNILAAGKNHFDFLANLCKVESVDSCTLYMDCKLRQAMFFTKSACPLKLLCMQIMGLACLPSSKSLRWEITDCIVKWLNNSMNLPNFNKIKWLPNSTISVQGDRCFNVTECLLYLLILCLKDYNAEYIHRDEDDVGIPEDSEIEKKKISCISVIAQGAVLLKRIVKMDSRQLHDNTYSLRFAVLLKAFLPSKSDLCHKTHMNHMTSTQVEAISWITDLVESDFGSSDSYLKQSTSAMPDTDVFNALKINDVPKII